MYKGDVAYGIKSKADMLALIEFFHEARGRTNSFRFKDWHDYEATDSLLDCTGRSTCQLTKVYGQNAVNNYSRTITKLVGSITMELGGSSFTDFTLDDETGIVTFTNPTTLSLDEISRETLPKLTTTTSHGLSTGDVIYINDATSSGGEFEFLEGMSFVIQKITATQFRLTSELDSQDFSTDGLTDILSSGEIYVYPGPNSVLTWSGTFDNHVRFDTDEISAAWDDYDTLSTSVPIVEVRG
jgi:hypothetical protein